MSLKRTTMTIGYSPMSPLIPPALVMRRCRDFKARSRQCPELPDRALLLCCQSMAEALGICICAYIIILRTAGKKRPFMYIARLWSVHCGNGKEVRSIR